MCMESTDHCRLPCPNFSSHSLCVSSKTNLTIVTAVPHELNILMDVADSHGQCGCQLRECWLCCRAQKVSSLLCIVSSCKFFDIMRGESLEEGLRPLGRQNACPMLCSLLTPDSAFFAAKAPRTRCLLHSDLTREES